MSAAASSGEAVLWVNSPTTKQNEPFSSTAREIGALRQAAQARLREPWSRAPLLTVSKAGKPVSQDAIKSLLIMDLESKIPTKLAMAIYKGDLVRGRMKPASFTH